MHAYRTTSFPCGSQNLRTQTQHTLIFALVLVAQKLVTGHPSSSACTQSGRTRGIILVRIRAIHSFRLCELISSAIVEVVDESPGDVAGIKSATLLVTGPYVFGYSQYETGVHRLVRVSPFDSAGARHTSFASVRVSPHFDDSSDSIGIELNNSDLKITTMRSQGAGVWSYALCCCSSVFIDVVRVNRRSARQ